MTPELRHAWILTAAALAVLVGAGCGEAAPMSRSAVVTANSAPASTGAAHSAPRGPSPPVPVACSLLTVKLARAVVPLAEYTGNMGAARCVYVASASSSQPGLAETVELTVGAGLPAGLSAVVAAARQKLQGASARAITRRTPVGLGTGVACFEGISLTGEHTASLLMLRRAGSFSLLLSTPRTSDACGELATVARGLSAKLH